MKFRNTALVLAAAATLGLGTVATAQNYERAYDKWYTPENTGFGDNVQQRQQYGQQQQRWGDSFERQQQQRQQQLRQQRAQEQFRQQGQQDQWSQQAQQAQQAQQRRQGMSGIQLGQNRQQTSEGQWIMQTRQIRQMLQLAQQAYSQNLDNVAHLIVQQASQEVQDQATQVQGNVSQRALRVASQQLDSLAQKIEQNQLQSEDQFRETANQVVQQLNQVNQVQQAQLNVEFQGTDEPQVSQYREQLTRAMSAYQQNNDQVAAAILRAVYQDLQRQGQQAQSSNTRALISRAATQTQQLHTKIRNNDLQSVAQFRQSANQILEQLNRAREIQAITQQGQYYEQGPRGQFRGDEGQQAGYRQQNQQWDNQGEQE